MKKIISLKRNSEFQALYKRGNSSVKPTMVVYATKSREPKVRLGLTAGKKIGSAVYRNRAKRRIREIFRLEMDSFKPNLNICIVARSKVLTETHEKIVSDFRSAAKELGLYNETL